MNIIKEHFTSIHQMLSVMESRQNNDVMAGRQSSRDNDKSFCGTKNWDEAISIFQNGYVDILDQIKAGVTQHLKAMGVTHKRNIRTNVVGYAPHVPNAILNLPNSMILTESQPQKVKAISIVYNMCANCGTGTEEFIKCGITLLSLVNTLELRGYRVNLQTAFFCAADGNDRAFGALCVKDYREHLDLQKLCFPVAHPSMFRRFGFKWLETCSGLVESDWSFGYGRSVSLNNDEKFAAAVLDKNACYIDLPSIKKNDYDVDKLIKSLAIC